MTTYNHAYDFAVEIPNSTCDQGDDVTAGQIRTAILERLHSLSDKELKEAVGCPYDSFEETEK